MYTKTTKTSYGKRITGSFKKILFGFVLFALATVLLFRNEGRYVKNNNDIGEAEKITVHIPDVSYDDGSLHGKLIHATARAITTDTLVDNQFNIRTNAIVLSRSVEYYQLVESSSTERRDLVGGAQEEVTTYSYKPNWVSRPINSNSFEDPTYKNSNFVITVIEPMTQTANNVTFGAYRLPSFIINAITGSTSVNFELSEEQIRQLENQISNKAPVRQTNNVVYFGKSMSQPEIGDVRITFSQIQPKEISLIAKVNNNTFEPYVTKNKNSFYQVSTGSVGKDQMFEAARQANRLFTWILRITGIIVVVMGLRAMFEILPTLFKVIPFLSKIVNIGVAIVCTILGVSWSLLIISISWLFYRPLIGIPLLVLSILGIWYLVKRGNKSSPQVNSIDTVTCPKCQKAFPTGTKFCPEDGTELVSKGSLTCPKCQKAFPAGTKFCPEDGTQLG